MNYNDIINLIPSKILKNKILNDKIELNPLTLFKIGYIYSESITDKLNICDYFIENYKNYYFIDNIINIKHNLEQGLDNFKNNNGHYIYEIEFTEENKKINYIETIFDQAIIKVKIIYFKYFYKMDYPVDICIKKREIKNIKDENWDNDIIDYLWLNKMFSITNIYFLDVSPELSDFEDCLVNNFDWSNHVFPLFFKECDLIKYGINNYGVLIHDQSHYNNKLNVEAMAYVVMLDENYFINNDIYKKTKGFYDILNYHIHIPFPELDVIDVKDAPKAIQRIYNEFLDFYKLYKNNK